MDGTVRPGWQSHLLTPSRGGLLLATDAIPHTYILLGNPLNIADDTHRLLIDPEIAGPQRPID